MFLKNNSTVRAMGNNLELLDENLQTVESPLLPPPSSYYTNQQNTAIFPYNITAVQQTTGNIIPTLNNILIDSNNNNNNNNENHHHHNSNINNKNNNNADSQSKLKENVYFFSMYLFCFINVFFFLT